MLTGISGSYTVLSWFHTALSRSMSPEAVFGTSGASIGFSWAGEDRGITRRQPSKPVIAAVSGHAVAAGLALAVWCDLRVIDEMAVFGVFCRRWGVPLIDGGTIRLPRLLGMSHAMDLILSGRGVSGSEAQRMGLANRLTAKGEALAGALELAEQLCQFPQLCMRNDRLSAYEQWDKDLDEALRIETAFGMEVIRSGETQAGAARFAAGKGRHGDFSDL